MSAGWHDAYRLQRYQQRPFQRTILRHTKIDAVDTEQAQILITGLLRVLVRAVDLGETCASLDEAELGGYEDIVSLASAFEPFADEFLTIAVQTARSVNGSVVSIKPLTQSYPNACSPADELDPRRRIFPRRWG